MRQGHLFDGAMEPGLICPECGFGHGHAPDCFDEFLPAEVAHFAGSSRNGSISYEEIGLYVNQGAAIQEIPIRGQTRIFWERDERRCMEIPCGTVFRFSVNQFLSK